MKLSRRDFLQISVLSAGAAGLVTPSLGATGVPRTINLVADAADSLIALPAVRWALQELHVALQSRGISVRRLNSLEQAPTADLGIVVEASSGSLAAGAIKKASMVFQDLPESLAFIPFSSAAQPSLLVCGSDARGLVYGLLELADRVRHTENSMQALMPGRPLYEQPFNSIRSAGRLFVSDVEDKSWFYDREMWPAYFSMLATNRFNRFSLNFGIGYDSLQTVKDAYLLFAYPFLLSVPGYDVRAVGLADRERERNLETLHYISNQAATHGVDFQLGIWTHGYRWGDSTQANYTIQGLSPDNHASYSRDSLTTLLKACPDISGVTIRTHGESGVREKSYAFWETVFSGIAKCGRIVNLDLHTKGLDERLVDIALATGLPVTLSPKYWAEHMGLPYHQAAIRDSEMPLETFNPEAFDALSTGSRIVTRYGYADFLREDRRYRVMHRIWPGTHRFLLWGDPQSTAAYSRAFRFCGSDGVELFEPLSFKGRRGSGIPGGRCAYADSSLAPRWDWEKYLYTYRVWGRLIYSPEADPDSWQRSLRQEFGKAAPSLEASLASASRLMPLVTTAHLPSAANDAFGPELYLNHSMLDPTDPPYWDTPVPKVFEYVSPLDPQLFSSIHEFVADLLQGTTTGKYSPIEVAQWLDDLALQSETNLKTAETHPGARQSAAFRRAAIDIGIQAGLGRFFAAKLRAGVLHAIHRQSGSRVALQESLNAYRRARDIWARFTDQEGAAYASDITFGPLPQQRGHWRDRLPAIDADIAGMSERLKALPDRTDTLPVQVAIRQVLSRPERRSTRIRHTAPDVFLPGEPYTLSLSTPEQVDPLRVSLLYRHVNQAERYRRVEMRGNGSEFSATIPASYTSTRYPLQYYFELRESPDRAWLYPGFDPDLNNQPYYVVRSRADTNELGSIL